jgi:hypothetical protein
MVRLTPFLAFASLGMLMSVMSTSIIKRSLLDVESALRVTDTSASNMCFNLQHFDGTFAQAEVIIIIFLLSPQNFRQLTPSLSSTRWQGYL